MNQRVKDSLEKFTLAISSLEKALSEPIKTQRDTAGVIQNFEFVYELAWKTLQRLIMLEGQTVRSPKETFKVAYQFGYLDDEKLWLDLIEDRNLTSHTYDEILAQKICEKIQTSYLHAFQSLLQKIKEAVSK